MKHRYGARDVVECRGAADIALDNAAMYERMAADCERQIADLARFVRRSGMSWKQHDIERDRLRAEAGRYRELAEEALARGLRDEAECAADPVKATGFEVGRGGAVAVGRGVPRYLVGRGGEVLSRRQAVKRRHRR